MHYISRIIVPLRFVSWERLAGHGRPMGQKDHAQPSPRTSQALLSGRLRTSWHRGRPHALYRTIRHGTTPAIPGGEFCGRRG